MAISMRNVSCLLVCLIGIASPTFGVTYRLDVNNTWSTTSHPDLFPTDAHFSWLGGGLHNDQVSFWNEGETTSPGMTEMAETGVIDMLADEIDADPNASNSLAYRWWFCPDEIDHNSCGPLTVEFDVTESHPLITLATMLGPSPDWFVGVSGLSLRENGSWKEEIVVDLRPYDGGTRSQNRWRLFGDKNDPPEPIAQILSGETHLVGPDSLGTMTFTLLKEPAPCDLDGDGQCGVADIDLLMIDLATDRNNLRYDMNGDGVMSITDRDMWLAFAGPENGFAGSIRVGDANLDGTVNSQDLNALGVSWLTVTHSWSNGNFVGDGVNSTDLNALAVNWQKSVPRAAQAVPEPVFSSTWLLLLVISLFRLRRQSPAGRRS